MIIDKNTNGVSFNGYCYEFDGDLIAETIDIKIDLKVTGSIKAGNWIKADCGIEAGLGIEAGEGIKAGNWIEAGKGIKAGWGIEAGEGIKAGCGIEAGFGIKGRVKKAFGIKTNFYLRIVSRWEIYILSSKIKIGCQLHDIAKLRDFSKDEIAAMDDDALEWWNENKAWVLAITDNISK